MCQHLWAPECGPQSHLNSIVLFHLARSHTLTYERRLLKIASMTPDGSIYNGRGIVRTLSYGHLKQYVCWCANINLCSTTPIYDQLPHNQRCLHQKFGSMAPPSKFVNGNNQAGKEQAYTPQTSI